MVAHIIYLPLSMFKTSIVTSAGLQKIALSSQNINRFEHINHVYNDIYN